MLDILDYTQQRLNTNINFWKFADTHISNQICLKTGNGSI